MKPLDDGEKINLASVSESKKKMLSNVFYALKDCYHAPVFC